MLVYRRLSVFKCRSLFANQKYWDELKIMGVHHPRLLIFAGNRGVNELLHSSLFLSLVKCIEKSQFLTVFDIYIYIISFIYIYIYLFIYISCLMVFYPTSFTCLHRRFMKNLQCAAQICPSAGRTRTAIHKRRHGSPGDPGAVGDGIFGCFSPKIMV